MNNSCFQSTGCSSSDYAALQQAQVVGSQSQKMATDAAFQGLQQQQQNLLNDAATLETLQNGATTASGQMQALGYANQFAAQQNAQLMQIRSLLVAQQQMIAARDQALADKEAQQAAASVAIRKNDFSPSPAKSWSFQ